jgi:hypothetical protein
MKTKTRLADFAARVNADPRGFRDAGELGCYITVNPMADETELLSQLGILASSCTKVDLYWKFANDVMFVQVQAKDFPATRTPGVYACKSPSGYTNIVVVVREPIISSKEVAEALRLVARLQLDQERLGVDLVKLPL